MDRRHRGKVSDRPAGDLVGGQPGQRALGLRGPGRGSRRTIHSHHRSGREQVIRIGALSSTLADIAATVKADAAGAPLGQQGNRHRAAGQPQGLSRHPASGSAFPAGLCHTVTWWPAATSRAAMRLPIAPSPVTATAVMGSPRSSRPADAPGESAGRQW
jgi:hypothetical protein